MLVIRREQMDALARATLRNFLLAMVRRLEMLFPRHLEARGLTGAALEATVGSSIRDAQRYGVADEHDIARYLDFVAVLGPHFDNDPANRWAADILERPDLDGTAKVNRITEYLIFVADQRPI